MKTVSNTREAVPGCSIVVYRMRRLIAGETVGLDTAFTEKEIDIARDYVARKLRDSRRRLMQVTAHLREKEAHGSAA